MTLFGFGTFQSSQLDAKQLKEMLQQLGHEVKDLNTEVGKEKFEVKFTTSDLNIPMGFEISPSKSYVWLTVYLGEQPPEGSPKNVALLKQNGIVQPCFFYITSKGALMMALPLDNRGITNAYLKDRSERLAENVGKTKSDWMKAP